MVDLFNLEESRPASAFRQWPKWAQYATAVVVAVLVWYGLVVVLRGVVVPSALVGAACYVAFRKAGPLSQREQVGFVATAAVAAFFLIGPWFVPVLRVVFLAALILGPVLLTRRRNKKKMNPMLKASLVATMVMWTSIGADVALQQSEPGAHVVHAGWWSKVSSKVSDAAKSVGNALQTAGGAVLDSLTANSPNDPRSQVQQAIQNDVRTVTTTVPQTASTANTYQQSSYTPPPPPPPPVYGPPTPVPYNFVGPLLPNQYREPAPLKTEQQICVESGRTWYGGACYESETFNACRREGGRMDGTTGGQCVIGGQVASTQRLACNTTTATQSWDAPANECVSNGVKAERDCLRGGRAYRDGRCMSSDEAIHYDCQKQSGIVSGGTCYTEAGVKGICNQAGYWLEDTKQCFVADGGAVPVGLGKWYYVATTAQEKAMLGQYRQTATLANAMTTLQQTITGQSSQVASLKQEVADAMKLLQEQHAAELAKLRLEFEEALRRDLEAEAQQEASHQYSQGVRSQQEVMSFLQERAQLSASGGQLPPGGGSIGTMTAAFTGAMFRDIRVEYPSGFPTPVKSTNGYTAQIPVKVTAGGMPTEAFDGVYQLMDFTVRVSADGGKTWADEVIELDETISINDGGSVSFVVGADFTAKTAGNYKLIVKGTLHFVELYDFASGFSHDLDGMARFAPLLERTFYTSANLFNSGSGTVTNVGSGGLIDGSVPGGLPGVLNTVSGAKSNLEAKARGLDAMLGLGAAVALKAAPIAVGVAIVGFGYAKGVLDFLPFVAKFRAKRIAAKAAKKAAGDMGSSPTTSDPFGSDDFGLGGL